jgi:conjugative transposon TraN protein
MFHSLGLHLKIILTGIFLMILEAASSQIVMESQPVEVTFNKTSSIVFPASITAVDRGSRDVLVQKVKGVDNVLQLKAGRANFKDTNLTVVTSDATLHHFFIHYSDAPATFTIQAMKSDLGVKTTSLPILFPAEMTDADMDIFANVILKIDKKRGIKSTSRHDMKLALLGIYIRNNVMFYQLRIVNSSNVAFHTDMLQFYVKDKQRVKRTASQEVVEVPLYHVGDSEVIPGKTTTDIVYALSKFTIPDAKILAIELTERRGGRHLNLDIHNKTIVKAQPIPQG